MTHHDWFSDCNKFILRGGSWASVDFYGLVALGDGIVSQIWTAEFTVGRVRANETVMSLDRRELVNAILTADEIKG